MGRSLRTISGSTPRADRRSGSRDGSMCFGRSPQRFIDTPRVASASPYAGVRHSQPMPYGPSTSTARWRVESSMGSAPTTSDVKLHGRRGGLRSARRVARASPKGGATVKVAPTSAASSNHVVGLRANRSGELTTSFIPTVQLRIRRPKKPMSWDRGSHVTPWLPGSSLKTSISIRICSEIAPRVRTMPLGSPVLPDVYWTNAGWSASSGLRSPVRCARRDAKVAIGDCTPAVRANSMNRSSRSRMSASQ